MHKKRVIFRHLKAFVSDARAVNKKCQKRLCVVGYTGVVNILSLLFYPFRSVHWAQTFSRYHNVLSHLKNLNVGLQKRINVVAFFPPSQTLFQKDRKICIWYPFEKNLMKKSIQWEYCFSKQRLRFTRGSGWCGVASTCSHPIKTKFQGRQYN